MTAIQIGYWILVTIYVMAAIVVSFGLGFHRGQQVRPKPGPASRGPNSFTIKRAVEEAGVPIEQFTCYDCPLAHKCPSAFDLYNLDGDCLEAK